MFVSMVIRDKVDPMTAHNALCGVKEYCYTLAADVPLPKQLPEHYKNKYISFI